MKCKRCRRQIPDNSMFCNWCGTEQIRIRNVVPVPKARRLADGRYTAQIMVEGMRYSVYGDTVEEYETNARALKAGLIEAKAAAPKHTLGDVMTRYISLMEGVLSPSTIRGYDIVRRNRFKAYADRYIDDIDWQEMVSAEVALCSPKTLKNAWAFVVSALKSVGIPKPSVNLPAVPKNELEWLDYEQIERLLKVVRGQRVELAVILALHSLRLSELLALTMDDIYDDSIHVRSARVRDKNNLCITKAMTKTAESTRTIHFLIPRIKEILPVSGRLVDYNQNSLYRAINRACREAQVPEVGVHGLRRSFASLAYHLGWSERSIMRVGGWSNINTMHNVYIKLAEKDVAADAAKMYDYYEFTTDSP